MKSWIEIPDILDPISILIGEKLCHQALMKIKGKCSVTQIQQEVTSD
jgi:hypothetical protein